MGVKLEKAITGDKLGAYVSFPPPVNTLLILFLGEGLYSFLKHSQAIAKKISACEISNIKAGTQEYRFYLTSCEKKRL